MVLVDTSLWIEHLRTGHPHLSELLISGGVACHPLIVGELACGNLRNRNEVLTLLKTLPQVDVAENDEVLYFLEEHQLFGKGLGIVDAHLLASAVLASLPIWTLDKNLQSAAKRLQVSYQMVQ